MCNDIDDNCDTWVDEGLDTYVLFADTDGDGFGDSSASITTCDANAEGYTDNNQDCDDSSDAIFPGAVEVCDGADNDCDAIVDESDAVDASVWYVDRDGDGYDDTTAYTSVNNPVPMGSEGADCDDRNDISPGQDEVCDTIDNNCDGLIDDASSVDAQTFYADTDKDGFGDPDAPRKAALS